MHVFGSCTVFFTKNATAASENPMLMYRNVDLNALSLKAKNCTPSFMIIYGRFLTL
jgi:hypothetical protein